MLTITNENNMELMARYGDKYFDLAIIDPNYGIGQDWKKRKHSCKKYSEEYKNDVLSNKEYFDEVFRVSKNWIIWGYNYYTHILPPTNYLICWDKVVSPKTGIFYSGFELAGTNIKIPAKIFQCPWDGGRKGKETGISKIHPHQKPILLYKWLLKKYAKPDYKILDTHLGSGSIAIACHDYDFDLTACEISSDHYKSAMKRINNHISQTKLSL